MDLILAFFAFIIILLSYSMLAWTIYEVFDSFKWWIFLGLSYATINIYFIITLTQRIGQNNRLSDVDWSKFTNHYQLIVEWRWDPLRLITKSISKWADANKITDAIIRIFTATSLSILYPFINSNSAIWSYALAWTFEIFLIVYRYKTGREFAIIITALAILPLLLLILFCILWYDSLYDEFFYKKQKRVIPLENMQLYDQQIDQFER